MQMTSYIRIKSTGGEELLGRTVDIKCGSCGAQSGDRNRYRVLIQRDQANSDKEYLQKLGQGFLNLGVMPSESMLNAMGMSQATAQLYINAVLAGL